MAKTIEDQMFADFQEYQKKLEAVIDDPWILPALRSSVQRLFLEVDQCYAKFIRSMRVGNPPGCPNDGGPTAADIAGEVQHDIG